jgi:hypothetical protein
LHSFYPGFISVNRFLEPLISLGLASGSPADRCYRPGDWIHYEYQIDAVEADELRAVESSVLWYTEGKGDEDLAVHYFERREAGDVEDGDLRPLHRVRIKLPVSPLSYNGLIVKIRWCVRVRVFLHDGRDTFFDQPFQLGTVPSAQSSDAAPERVSAEPSAEEPASIDAL